MSTLRLKLVPQALFILKIWSQTTCKIDCDGLLLYHTTRFIQSFPMLRHQILTGYAFLSLNNRFPTLIFTQSKTPHASIMLSNQSPNPMNLTLGNRNLGNFRSECDFRSKQIQEMTIQLGCLWLLDD